MLSRYHEAYLNESWEIGMHMFEKAVEKKQEEVMFQLYLFDRLLMALNGKVVSFSEYCKLGTKPVAKDDAYYQNIIAQKDRFK